MEGHLMKFLFLLCAHMLVPIGATNPDVESYKGKILVYAPFGSRSVLERFRLLVESMANRGHQVSIISPFKFDTGHNITSIIVEDPAQALIKSLGDFGKWRMPGSQMLENVVEGNAAALSNKEVRQLLNESFDIVLVYAMMPRDLGYYLTNKTGASLVLLIDGGGGPMFYPSWAIGQPHPLSYLPYSGLHFRHPLSIFNKLYSALLMTFEIGLKKYLFYRHELVVKEEFPNEAEVSLEEVEKTASLVLFTGHPMLDGIRPLAPNFQYIGFIQCREPKPLPDHLEAYMQSGAEHGIIYVSFGSLYQESDLSSHALSVMLSVFGTLDQKVLFKWKGNVSMDVPSNVMMSGWFPQQDILGHKNTRMFITHGGKASVQEAIYHEVPMVVMPIGLDQFFFAAAVKQMGIGEDQRFPSLTKESLSQNINSVLTNPEYKKVIQRYRAAVLDEISSPLDRGIWWLEYVMRNKGRNFWKPQVHQLSWIQYFLLDVMAFVAVSFFICFYFIKKAWQHLNLPLNYKKIQKQE